MADKSVRINFVAEMKSLLQNLHAMGVSAEDSKKAVAELTSEFNRANKTAARQHRDQVAQAKAAQKAQEDAARAATKAANDQKSAFDAGVRGIEKLGQLAGGVGGQVTAALGDIVDVAEGGAGALGGLGLAGGIAAAGLAAVGVGAAALLSGAISLVEGAGPLVERLKEIEGAGELPAATIQSLEDYERASLGAEVVAGELKVQAAALVAEGLEPMLATVVGLARQWQDLLPTLQDGAATMGTIQSVGRAGAAVFSLGATEIAAYAFELDAAETEGREWVQTLRDMEDAQKAVNEHTAIGEKVAAIQRDAILAMSGASDARQQLARETDEIDTATQAYIDSLHAEVEAGRQSADMAQVLADSAANSAQVRKDQLLSAVEQKEAEEALAASRRANAEASRNQFKDERELAAVRAAEEAELERLLGAQEALQAIRGAATAETLSLEERLTHEYLAQLAAVDEAERVSKDHAGADAARAALDAQYKWDVAEAGIAAENKLDQVRRDLNEKWLADQRASFDAVMGLQGELVDELVGSWTEMITGQLDAIADRAGDIAADAAAMAEEARSELTAYQEEFQANGAAQSAEEWAAHQIRLSQLEAEADRAEDIAAQKAALEEEARLKAFKAEQAGAVVTATMDAARAAIALIPAFAYAGPAAPALAALTAGAALTFQLGTIYSQSPPEAHQGVAEIAPAPDEIDYRLRSRESVLTPGATAELGADMVDHLNGGGSADMGVPVFELDGRAIAAELVRRQRPGRKQRSGTAPRYRR